MAHLLLRIGAAGFEPAVSRPQTECDNQASLRPEGIESSGRPRKYGTYSGDDRQGRWRGATPVVAPG